MPMPTGSWENPQVCERLKIPKTDYLLTDYGDEESVSVDFQVCWPQKYRVPYHLKVFAGCYVHYE